MSFFGMGRPQPSSEEKIGMMENEIIAMSDLHNRFVGPYPPLTRKDGGNAEFLRCGFRDFVG